MDRDARPERDAARAWLRVWPSVLEHRRLTRTAATDEPDDRADGSMQCWTDRACDRCHQAGYTERVIGRGIDGVFHPVCTFAELKARRARRRERGTATR